MKIEKTILGPPGCGKTQTNSNLIQGYIKEGIEPQRIACVSFSKKAARESKERVCNDWNILDEDLPYFRTLHSMAFGSLGFKTTDVLRGKDMKEIGYKVGLDFAGKSTGKDTESDFEWIGNQKGDEYLKIYQLSRSRLKSLEEVFQEEGNYNLIYSELTRLVEAYENYKKVKGKVDFTDMIERFIAEDQCPDIEALIVDEAQDLSTLQWKMIDTIRQSPNIQIFTGDDDQAIMNFQGADVQAFLSATKEKEVLNQSYRIPETVWEQAQQIVTRIDDRAPKEWHPKKEKGSIFYHNSLEEVPIETGEWTILASTNRLLDRYALQLREEGWIYSRHDHPSIPRKLYDAILSWESLSKGEEITVSQVKNIYDHMNANEGFKKGFGGRSKKFLELPADSLIRMDYLRDHLGLLVDGSQRWHQVLGKVGLNTQNYLLNALKRGDNVKSPRIKLSTIHSMKGGESDNILLISDISYAASKEMITRPSTLHRMFYVGVTRTKENLHIMQPETERYYEL